MDGEVLRVRGVCGGLRMGRAPHGASFWGGFDSAPTHANTMGAAALSEEVRRVVSQ